MAKKWSDGELLLTLHQERRFRLNKYQPDTVFAATLADAARIDAEVARLYRNTAHLQRMQPEITAECLRRLGVIEYQREQAQPAAG